MCSMYILHNDIDVDNFTYTGSDIFVHIIYSLVHIYMYSTHIYLFTIWHKTHWQYWHRCVAAYGFLHMLYVQDQRNPQCRNPQENDVAFHPVQTQAPRVKIWSDHIDHFWPVGHILASAGCVILASRTAIISSSPEQLIWQLSRYHSMQCLILHEKAYNMSVTRRISSNTPFVAFFEIHIILILPISDICFPSPEFLTYSFPVTSKEQQLQEQQPLGLFVDGNVLLVFFL